MNFRPDVFGSTNHNPQASPLMSSVSTSVRPLLLAALAASLSPLAACSDSGAGPSAPVASTLVVTSTQTQSAVAGAAVASAPSVKALSSSGAAVAGLPVTFTVVSGGGTLSAPSATTDAAGIATAGTWTLGTTAGTQTVRAEAAGLPTVLFTATAVAGAAAQVTVSAGNNQTALTGAAVTTKPSVIVKDANGNPVSGATVTFSVQAGGGTITGGTATTDATGIATVGSWTLGIVPGAQALRATAGTLSASIAATANLPTGCVAAPFAIGATIPGTWATGDCVSPGNRGIFDPAGALYDQYELTLAAATQLKLSLTGAVDRSLRIRRKATGDIVAQMAGTAFNPTNATGTLELKYILAPDAYVIEVQSPASGATGNYALSSSLDATLTCTPAIFGTTDITVTDKVDASTDCAFMGGYEDRIIMILPAGINLRLTMSSTEMAPFLVFRDDRLGPSSPTLKTARLTAPGTATFDWTTTFAGYYEVVLTTLDAVAGQKYTFKVEKLP